MRLLHVTDTHLGHAGANGALARIAARAFANALAPAMGGRVDAVLHSGDLFDRSEPPATAVAYARALLGAVGKRVPVVVIAGNHDRRGLTGHVDGLGGVRVVDVPDVVRVAGLRIGCLPHTREATTWTAQAADLVRRGVHVLAAHQSFDGHRVPGFTFRAGRSPETVGADGIPAVSHILCGHLHPRQVVDLGGARIVGPGSTVRTSFREGPEPKSIAFWTFDAEISYAFAPLPSPRWHLVRSAADLADVADGDVVGTRDPDLAEAAANRGAVLLHRPDRPEAPLFGL